MRYTFFLGTNAVLSASEALACLNRLAIQFTFLSCDSHMLRIETPNPLPITIGLILGGTIRITEDIATWNHVPSPEDVLQALSPLPQKWALGISSNVLQIPLRKFAIEMKKLAKQEQSKMSFIEPKGRDGSLNAAQVLFNKLTHSPNADIAIVRVKNNFILLKTISIQDISAYELRDTMRPARDAKVGLLPPKLAQIMINLGARVNTAVYDPFCGMGTILQESWLMGFQSIGSDASQRMLDYSASNVDWLSHHVSVLPELHPELFLHDVTHIFPETLKEKNISVVTEPFLGTPLTQPLSPAELIIFHNEIIELYRKFFNNIHVILKPGSQLLVLLPAPKGEDGFTPLPRDFIDEITAIGYRKKQFVPDELTSHFQLSVSSPVLYARPDALVAREVTLWESI